MFAFVKKKPDVGNLEEKKHVLWQICIMRDEKQTSKLCGRKGKLEYYLAKVIPWYKINSNLK